MRKDEELALAGKELMLEQPFYGLFLIGLNKEWNNAIPTAGVSKHNINYKLVINSIIFLIIFLSMHQLSFYFCLL